MQLSMHPKIIEYIVAAYAVLKTIGLEISYLIRQSLGYMGEKEGAGRW